MRNDPSGPNGTAANRDLMTEKADEDEKQASILRSDTVRPPHFGGWTRRLPSESCQQCPPCLRRILKALDVTAR